MRSIVIAVRVQNDRQSQEVVTAAKHRSRVQPISRVPNGEPIAKQILAFAVNLEVYMHLPVDGCTGLHKWNNHKEALNHLIDKAQLFPLHGAPQTIIIRKKKSSNLCSSVVFMVDLYVWRNLNKNHRAHFEIFSF